MDEQYAIEMAQFALKLWVLLFFLAWLAGRKSERWGKIFFSSGCCCMVLWSGDNDGFFITALIVACDYCGANNQNML